MHTHTPDTPAALAERLRKEFLGQPFGIIRFWRFAVVRPNDQSYVLISTHLEGDRLDLVYVHESRQGLAGVLSVWGAQGLEAAPAELGRGIALRSAERLRFEQAEAWQEGERYRIRTPRGEGDFPIAGTPALTLAH